MQPSKLSTNITNNVGIKESREVIKPVGTLINVGKFAIAKDIPGALGALLPLFTEIQEGREGLDKAWNEEVPDLDLEEIGVITDDFTEITGSPNYGKIGGGIAMVLSGVTAEVRRLRNENESLKKQVRLYQSQKLAK